MGKVRQALPWVRRMRMRAPERKRLGRKLMKQWGSAGTFKRLDTGTTLYGTRVSRRTMARVVFPFLNPVLAAVIRDIDQITGFGLSEADEEPFLYSVSYTHLTLPTKA